MMKSSLEENRETLNTTPIVKNISDLPAKENRYLYNYTDKLAADHDVTASDTMIKVTYKKALKDRYASPCSDVTVNFSKDSVLIENNMNTTIKPEVSSNKSKNRSESNSKEFVLVPHKIKLANLVEQDDEPVSDSAPKQGEESPLKRKKDHVNGINLVKIKVKEVVGNDNDLHSSAQPAINKLIHTSTLSKSKITSAKKVCSEEKIQSNNIKFLKDVSIIKVKNSISENNIVAKKSDSIKFKLKLKKVSSENGTSKKKKKERRDEVNSNFKLHKMKKTGLSSKDFNKKLSVSKGKLLENVKKVKSNQKSLAEAGRVEDSSNKKPILLVDPDLPAGWTRHIRTRNKGCTDEKHIVYVISPQGKKFRFKWKLRKYLEKTKSTLDIDKFFFGLYKRTRPPTVAVADEEETKEVSEDESSSSAPRDVLEKGLSKNVQPDEIASSDVSKTGKGGSADGRELLLYDPNLPFGWKRIINSNNSNGKLQVQIISPEGRIFRRRYRLNEYLTKHQYTHNLDRFYFGLYPKKDSMTVGTENGKNSMDCQGKEISAGSRDLVQADDMQTEPDVIIEEEGDEDDEYEEKGKYEEGVTPMYDDPNLPEGWKRYIKIRGCGESAGRMEVVIVSPDGRRHRSRGYLEHYLQRKNLNYNAEDFDFTVFGRSKKRPVVTESKDLNSSLKKKFKWILNDKPVPDLDMNKLKEETATPEGQMINTVHGLMINCELSTARSERRSRLPRREHEKIVRSHLESEGEASLDGCNIIPSNWIQRFVKCRSDFRALEPDAIFAIAERTKDFVKELSRRAFDNSRCPEEGLRYEDVADVVENSECLSPLKTLIPRKITYREYIRLNRPKQFLSFT